MTGSAPEGEISEKDQARFWSKVALPNEQGCMLWLKSTTHDGYGKFYYDGQVGYAHVFSYLLAHGPIPAGHVVDHVKAQGCTNRHCVAPDHLEAVTQRENLLRGDTIIAAQVAKTHCPQGHPYAGDNLITEGPGRRCRECRRQYDRARRPRKTA